MRANKANKEDFIMMFIALVAFVLFTMVVCETVREERYYEKYLEEELAYQDEMIEKLAKALKENKNN